jgi:nitrite reductase/ring-hydroxylating ferredoxin subunit
MGRHVIAHTREIPPGERKIVEVDGRSIGVFNVKGRYHALRNTCPHQAAPLCLGTVTGTAMPSRPGEYIWARDGEIVRCPWHGWEFDITTGKSVFNPHRLRVKTYRVTVEPRGEDGQAGPPQEVDWSADAEDPSVETYPVTVEDGWVVLHT